MNTQPRVARRRAAAVGGFTLLEVLIAVVLLLAIAALIWPDFTSLGVKATRNATTDSLQAACDVARSRAMSQLVPVRLVATKHADGWSLDAGVVPRVNGDDASGGFDELESVAQSSPVRIGELPPNVAVVSTDETQSPREEPASSAREGGPGGPVHIELLVVLPDGSVQASSARLLHRGKRAAFTVQRWTGRIAIGEWLSEESDEIEATEHAEEPNRSPSTSSTNGANEPMEDAKP